MNKKRLHIILSFVLLALTVVVLTLTGRIASRTLSAHWAAQAEERAARAVLPTDIAVLETRISPAERDQRVYVGFSDAAKTNLVGYAVPGLSPHGYGGPIRLMVGLRPDRSVLTYQVLESQETEDLGAKLADPEFVGQFKGKSAARPSVKEDGGDIEALTGATVTSRAVCAAISNACSRLDRLEGKVPPAAARAAENVPAAPNEGRVLVTVADAAPRVIPGHPTAVTPLSETAFVGKNAAGDVLGYALVGTGTGKGPHGEIKLRVMFGFTARRTPSFNPPPVQLNAPTLEMTDMETAQRTAYNAALQSALAEIRKLPAR